MVILLLVAAVWVSRSAARLEQRIEAVRAAGDPLSLADLACEPIPPETNAAVFLRRAEADLEAIGKELLSVYESESYCAGRPTGVELKTIGSALEAYPNVIPLLERAADCPDYDSQPDYSLDPPVFLASFLQAQNLRPAARLLKARALFLQSEGKPDEALEQCVLMLRLARHFDREPLTLSYLVAVACRGVAVDTTNQVLRSGPVSKSARDALEAELALHDNIDAFRWALKSERAFGMDSYRAIPARNWWPIRAMWDNDAAAYLDVIDQHLKLASQPHSQVAAAGPVSDAGSRRAVLTQLAEPAILAGRVAADNNRAAIRCLRVLNALQALERPGDAPQPKLSDLGLPAEATVDPFTGEPLKLRKLPEGWLIYSVGQNLTDDGGKLDDRRSDVGLGPLIPAADRGPAPSPSAGAGRSKPCANRRLTQESIAEVEST